MTINRINRIRVRGVGPIADASLEPGPGMTLVTGHNGLGRTLLLDGAWRTLTGAWPAETNERAGTGYAAMPARKSKKSQIETEMSDEDGHVYGVACRPSAPQWSGDDQCCRSAVIYAHGNGALSMWAGVKPARDAIRMNRSDGSTEGAGPWHGLLNMWGEEHRNNTARGGITLSATDVFVGGGGAWHGLGQEVRELRGSTGGRQRLNGAVACCIPERHRPEGPDALIDNLINGIGRGGAIERWTVLGVAIAWITTLTHPRNRGRGLTLLIDDVENHLHPSWEREALDGLHRLEQEASLHGAVQTIATTNAAMVLAGAEPWCQPDEDVLATLIENADGTRIVQGPLIRQGTAQRWLMSDALGLRMDRSIAGEKAIDTAKAISLEASTDTVRIAAADAALRRALADDDEFWPRWRYFAKQHLNN